jgi:F-type H+-transporting ATPase subunit alpha
MELRAEEISQIIKEQITDYDKKVELSETGVVLSVGDGIARIYGLEKAMALELVEFPGGILGLVLNLEEDNVGVSPSWARTPASKRATWSSAPVALPRCPLARRFLDALLVWVSPWTAKAPSITTHTSRVEMVAPGVIASKSVHEPCYTGLKAVDAMTPVGRGQRELIIGDRQIGKTAVAIDAILAQKDTDVFAFTWPAARKNPPLPRCMPFSKNTAPWNIPPSCRLRQSDPATLQYLAPYAGCAMGEYFRDKGQHALIIYDDLSKQAAAYRQVSLLLRRPPGREAYPGDIFYNHSRLLERSAKV